MNLKRKRARFLQNYNKEDGAIEPTIYFMISMDYKTTSKILEWIGSSTSKRLNKNKTFWIYCLLSQIDEELVDSETMGSINSILKKCIDDMKMDKEENMGVYSTIIAIIVYVFK